jgi:FtsP/CotA-like multicopper oxidase with cupredoxin domain
MRIKARIIFTGLVLLLLGVAIPAWSDSIEVQFPCDIDNFPYDWTSAPTTTTAKGPEDIDWNGDGMMNMLQSNGTTTAACPTNYRYIRLGATDGYSRMADGLDLYTFGFLNLTGIPENLVSAEINHAEFPAPTLVMKEGEHVYLNLSNLGMIKRPDLFDPHTIHFHGFPNAASVFDGEPMASFGVRMGSTATYYYEPVDPGTYMFHCHQEATEHMEMGMLGNLVVRPLQNGTAYVYSGQTFTQFAYNDFDGTTGGSTGYDVEAMIKIADFDPIFHQRDEIFQPPRFAEFEARYFMLNGRGYPDTIDAGKITNDTNHYPSQKINSLVTVNTGLGQRTLLLRIINLSIQNFTNIEIPGLPVKVAGRCAKLLRGPNPRLGTGPGPGNDTSYYVSSMIVGPGESVDLIIDTQGVATGTYYLFSRNLEQLNSDLMDRSGAMTEIVIN